MQSSYVVLVFAAIAACPPRPPSPPPEPDVVAVDAAVRSDGADDAYVRACTNLHALGCSEGDHEDLCMVTLRLADQTQRTDLRVDCLVAAASKDAARACGTVACP